MGEGEMGDKGKKTKNRQKATKGGETGVYRRSSS